MKRSALERNSHFLFCRQRRRREEEKLFNDSPRAKTPSRRSRPRLSTSWLCGRKNAGTGPRVRGRSASCLIMLPSFLILTLFFDLFSHLFKVSLTPVFFNPKRKKGEFRFLDNDEKCPRAFVPPGQPRKKWQCKRDSVGSRVLSEPPPP